MAPKAYKAFQEKPLMMLSSADRFWKRAFDLLLALIALPLILPVLVLLVPLASLSMGQWGGYSQKRIGQHGKVFSLYKIRSLKGSKHESIQAIKEAQSNFGKWLRTTKLDELPQVFNVLLGHMSWVGPRPDIPGYADRLEGEDRIILSVRPGITGPATLKYRNEEELLLQQTNPQEYNDTVIWPDKVRINKEYVQNWSLRKDLGYLWRSFF